MFLRYDYIIILYKFFIIARVFYRTAAKVIWFEYKSLILHNVCAVHFSVFSWKNYVITKQYRLVRKKQKTRSINMTPVLVRYENRPVYGSYMYAFTTNTKWSVIKRDFWPRSVILKWQLLCVFHFLMHWFGSDIVANDHS